MIGDKDCVSIFRGTNEARRLTPYANAPCSHMGMREKQDVLERWSTSGRCGMLMLLTEVA